MRRAGYRCRHLHYRKHRACQRRHEIHEAYAPPANGALAAEPGTLPPDAYAHDTPETPSKDLDGDIVEREADIALIVEVARSLQGYSVEHAISIVEARDTDTGAITHRFIAGDINKGTPDSAELATIQLAPNERLIADVHSHPLMRPCSRDFTEISLARQATQANFYPGVEDYGAMVRRGVVSAIVDPGGGVMLLRRVAGSPSVRKVYGEALAPPDERAADNMDVAYLYAQGYLADGDWVRPSVGVTLHAGP